MREYSKVSPTFWTGNTGKAIRKQGHEAVIVALYLMTAPGSNMLGLYYQPVLFMAHETGLGFEGASKGLQRCIEAGFCLYDDRAEMVWVIEMASYQIADKLKASDNRCQGIQRDYDALPENRFLDVFFDHYAGKFHLTNRRAPEQSQEGAGEAPSKPLPSQEQEQEQEKAEAIEPLRGSQDSPESKPADVKPIRSPEDKVCDTVLAAYHLTLPSCQRVEVLTPKRRKRILAADKLAGQVCRQQGWEMPRKDFWLAYFGECSEDPWLRGELPNPNNPRWRQNLEVLLAEERFAEIMDKAIARGRAEQPQGRAA